MPIKRSYASHGDACATSHALELLGDRWTYPVLRELFLAPKRFAELAAALHGITPAVLTARLRQLEVLGLVSRTDVGSRGSAYAATDWATELRPALELLGRWALRSPVCELDGCGLTPDAMVQSMLTMAPLVAMEPPIELELRFSDARIGPHAPVYAFRLTWADRLSIARGTAAAPLATVTGDSSTWMRVLYDGAGLDKMDVAGDAAAVQRVVDAFAGLLENA